MARSLNKLDVKDIVDNFNTAYEEAVKLNYSSSAAAKVALAIAKADAGARTQT